MEVYVDGMLIKILEAKEHLGDLEETLNMLRRYQMKLNPAKCAFMVLVEKFIGFMVSQRGMEANPKKIRAILDMKPPYTTKEVQRLAVRVVTLSQFISRSTDKCFIFFHLL